MWEKLSAQGPTPKSACLLPFMTWFYENGRISTNNGPILKIRNLAYSGLQARSV